MDTCAPAKLAYKIFEPSTGADENLNPIIFLHSCGATKENWSDIPQIVADGTKRKSYAFDARNHGDSEYCNLFNFKIIIDDLFHFMDAIKAPKATIIGHSMGGIAAMGAALRKPERIELIIIEDMLPKKFSKRNFDIALNSIKMRSAVIENIPGHLNDSEAVKFFLDSIFNHFPEKEIPFTKTPDLYNVKIPFVRKDGGFDVKFDKERILKALQDSENVMNEPSGQYHGPAHFLYGNRSGYLIGNEKENIKMFFPNAKFIAFENASHFIHMEYPKEFSDKVLHIYSNL